MNSFIVIIEIQLPNTIDQVIEAYETNAIEFNKRELNKGRCKVISIEQQQDLMDNPSMGDDLTIKQT